MLHVPPFQTHRLILHDHDRMQEVLVRFEVRPCAGLPGFFPSPIAVRNCISGCFPGHPVAICGGERREIRKFSEQWVLEQRRKNPNDRTAQRSKGCPKSCLYTSSVIKQMTFDLCSNISTHRTFTFTSSSAVEPSHSN